jgi:hypothetical protein
VEGDEVGKFFEEVGGFVGVGGGEEVVEGDGGGETATEEDGRRPVRVEEEGGREKQNISVENVETNEERMRTKPTATPLPRASRSCGLSGGRCRLLVGGERVDGRECGCSSEDLELDFVALRRLRRRQIHQQRFGRGRIQRRSGNVLMMSWLRKFCRSESACAPPTL